MARMPLLNDERNIMGRTSQKSIIHLLRHEVVRIEENKYAIEKMVKLSDELLRLIKTSNKSIETEQPPAYLQDNQEEI